MFVGGLNKKSALQLYEKNLPYFLQQQNQKCSFEHLPFIYLLLKVNERDFEVL